MLKYLFSSSPAVKGRRVRLPAGPPVVKGRVSAPSVVPPHILCPEYAHSGRPYQSQGDEAGIMIYPPKDFPRLREAGQLARRMLDYANSLAAPGVTTDYIDAMVFKEIVRNGAYPSPLNYAGFPKSICTSVNEVICHGIPDDRPLEEGDLLSIDVSLFYNGFHGDNCGNSKFPMK